MELIPLIPRISVPKRIEYPAIDPVPQGVNRPFWSVMIPTYNRAKYLERTLRSVLEQSPGPDEMQIEVIDNCSTENDPEAVVRKMGQNSISFYRQPKHVGMSANWNTCINRARGHWVHILHDDDMVLPGFYNRLREASEKEPAIGSAFCRFIYMDEGGHWQSLSSLERKTPGVLSDWLVRIAVVQLIQSPAVVVKRRVYEELGGFCPELSYAIDWEMWKRIAANFPVWHEPQPLACFRVHDSSESARIIRSGLGADIADTRRAIEISQSYLPERIASELSSKAREHYALYGLNTARRMVATGDMVAAIAQIREALKCSCSLRVIRALLYFFMWTVARWTRRTVGGGGLFRRSKGVRC